MKKCTVCKKDQELVAFSKKARSKDGLQNICKPCVRKSFKAYYDKNREKQIAAVAARKALVVSQCREYVFNYLATHPCVDCGYSDIRVLEFDHVRGEKKNGVALLARSGCSLATIKTEIAKCEVRCKNCHVIVTYDRMGGTWHDKFLVAESVVLG